MVAISSRSEAESERVVRPRMLETNLAWAGSSTASVCVCEPADKPLVNGFFAGVNALRIWSSLTSSAASALLTPRQSTAPMAATETIASKFRVMSTFDIASPSCLFTRFQTASQAQNGREGNRFPLCLRRLPDGSNTNATRTLMHDPEKWTPFSGKITLYDGLKRDSDSISGCRALADPVAVEFLDNVGVHGLGIGYIQ